VATSQLDHERLGGQHPKPGACDQSDALAPGLVVELEQVPDRLELVGLVQIVHSCGKAGAARGRLVALYGPTAFTTTPGLSTWTCLINSARSATTRVRGEPANGFRHGPSA